MQMSFSAQQVPDNHSVYELVKSLKLQKAMQTGDYNRFGTEPGNASALKPESLDQALINTTYTRSDIQFLRLLQRNPVDNSITQYDELTSYAENTEASFFPEGGAPPQDSATFIRRLNQIKYLGVARGITHQLSLQRTINQSALTIETQAGIMDLLGKTERSLWHADSDLSHLQFDGLFAQLKKRAPKENIIDLHGRPLVEDDLVDGATLVRSDPNYGQITHLFGSIGIKGDIARTFIQRSVVLPMANDNTGVIGNNIRAVETPAGVIDLVGTTMMGKSTRMPEGARGPAIAIPSVPTINSVTVEDYAFSNYRDSDAGLYNLWLIAKNDAGASAPVLVSQAALNVEAGQAIKLNVTPAPGNPTKWFELWKTPKNGVVGSQRIVLRAANTDPDTHLSNVGPTTLVEYNDTMPGCEDAVGLQMDIDSLCLDVLAGCLRIPQPIQGTSLPFLLVSYLALILKAPRKTIWFKNVGRLPRQTVIA